MPALSAELPFIQCAAKVYFPPAHLRLQLTAARMRLARFDAPDSHNMRYEMFPERIQLLTKFGFSEMPILPPQGLSQTFFAR